MSLADSERRTAANPSLTAQKSSAAGQPDRLLCQTIAGMLRTHSRTKQPGPNTILLRICDYLLRNLHHLRLQPAPLNPRFTLAATTASNPHQATFRLILPLRLKHLPGAVAVRAS